MNFDFIPLHKDSPYLIDAIRVYNEYIPGELDRQEHFFRTHMRRPGYIASLIRADKKIIGVAFGSDSLRGQWWHERVASQVGYEHPALQDAWELTQLHVLKAYRNRGIGARLLQHITEKHNRPRMLLSTQVANVDAQRFYLRHGWKILHQGFKFSAGDEPYKILHKSLKSD